MKIAYFTNGGQGAGHLAKAYAIHRALRRAGRSVTFRVFTNVPPIFEIPDLEIEFIEFDNQELLDRSRVRDHVFTQALRRFAPDVVLVDISYRIMQGVIEELGLNAWLLLRWMPSQYLRGPLNRSFRPELFARVIGVEPILPFPVPEHVEPIVTLNPEECWDRERVRREFNVEEGQSLTFMTQDGYAEEARRARERGGPPPGNTERERLVVVGPEHGGAQFPIARYFNGVDRLVGGAGYNLYWECRWLGMGERAELRSVFPVGSHLIDDQTPRLQRASQIQMKENGADQLARLLLRGG